MHSSKACHLCVHGKEYMLNEVRCSRVGSSEHETGLVPTGPPNMHTLPNTSALHACKPCKSALQFTDLTCWTYAGRAGRSLRLSVARQKQAGTVSVCVMGKV